ncbi:CopG family transcriptional regulator [Candidatus Poribacteria bacterium]|nr:CopG family transcriptional regulator [Candidatus Poribacteria bacterium]
MKRTNIYLTDKQHEALSKIAKEEGTKLSELVRRAVDEYLARLKRIPKS